MTRPVLALATLVTLLSGCAGKSDPDVVHTSIYEPQPVDPVICKRISPVGSHLKRNVCNKQSEWEAITRASKRWLREIDRRNNAF